MQKTQVPLRTLTKQGCQEEISSSFWVEGSLSSFVHGARLTSMGLPRPDAGVFPKDYNAFLQIAEDGTVTCFTGKIEMGQGIITSLPQMMADELNVPLEKVKMVMGDTDLCPWDGGTWGSLTTRSFGPSMRAAAAEARGVLLDLASAQLGVPVAQLEVKDGIISDTKDPRKRVCYAACKRKEN